MATDAPMDVIPLWAILPATLIAMLICTELGHRIGRSRNAREHEPESTVGGMVAAELGLLAFLLAITFSLVANRFDTRRELVLKESNAIGTCYLRAAMLPAANGTEARRLLKDYVEIRLQAARSGDLAASAQKCEQIQVALWDQATAAASADPHSIPIGLFISSLNDVIDVHAMRLQAVVRARLPFAVWAILFSVSALAFLMMGYHSGLCARARSPGAFLVTLAFSLVIWLVADMERPHEGLLFISQQPMIDLRNSMEP
jgi:hypothetical protein